ncbi:hypothetical protein F3Y22_tig00117034pilonHSYRG01594 [Hibiscus syriacus]|uniref:Uncharacterized protein n=1 Tax=Hibiscus syriacus TaxID=106335 RepID=A0A6A2WBA0_HIBSY|nr:hypothetical protein F3Y22_tig00117034pilonHSYRG01594 [Hibiscus syriacus]
MKRPSVSEQEQPKESKRSKKKSDDEGFNSTDVVEEEVKKAEEDEKKQFFQRLFSDDGEIVVLKGGAKMVRIRSFLNPMNNKYLNCPKRFGVDIKSSKSSASLFDKKSGVGSLEDEILKHGLHMDGEEKRAALWEK